MGRGFPRAAAIVMCALLLIGLGVLGCGSEQALPQNAITLTFSGNTAQSTAQSRADISSLVSGNSAFALDLFKTARTKGGKAAGNLVFSPYGLSLALGMTYAGQRDLPRPRWPQPSISPFPRNAFTPVLARSTRMVLVDAISFSGLWTYPFPPGGTQMAPFHLADGIAVQVPFMHHEMEFGYVDDGSWQAVELPYGPENSNEWGDCSMVCLLTKEGGLDTAIQGLTAEGLQSLLAGLSAKELVQAAMPRFKFDSNLPVKAACQALGMTDAFDPGRADFSAMYAGGAPSGIWIDNVYQTATISVGRERDRGGGRFGRCPGRRERSDRDRARPSLPVPDQAPLDRGDPLLGASDGSFARGDRALSARRHRSAAC